MLPSSKKYLIKSGYTPSAAAWLLLAGFMIGFIGIQVVSRFLRHYIPSHVFDCDHNHEKDLATTPTIIAEHNRMEVMGIYTTARRRMAGQPNPLLYYLPRKNPTGNLYPHL
jgi:hypothetical protein